MISTAQSVNLSETGLNVIIAVVTFLLSVSASMFISGMRYGEMRADMRTMADRLAKIEGMFTLTLKQQEHDGRSHSDS